MSTPTPTPTGNSSTSILPFILPHISTAFHLTTRVPSYLSSYIPWTPLLAPISYLIAPFTTFISIFLSVTLFTPYSVLSWFFDAIYPLYVLCGVACITGGILGLAARLVSLGIVRATRAPRAIEARDQQEQWHDDLEEEDSKFTLKGIDDAALAERSAKRRRLGRKERDGKVKFEPSA